MSTALYRIGWIYNDLEDYDSAIDFLRRVILLQPTNAAAFFELGYANKKVERYNEALVAFRQAASQTRLRGRSLPARLDLQRTEEP
jgi:tetratricopeptide (TPR) repeat protein